MVSFKMLYAETGLEDYTLWGFQMLCNTYGLLEEQDTTLAEMPVLKIGSQKMLS